MVLSGKEDNCLGQSQPERGYIPTLDGWRAVAIVAVMVSHAKTTLSAFGWGEQALIVASWGRLGVDLFFAISGYLICSRLLREYDVRAQISLKGFYCRRFFRIFPLYYTYLAVLSLLAAFAGVPASRSEVIWSLFFLRNYASMSEGAYTNHFWSLAVEEHFYLCWPLFLALVRPRVALWATPVLALCVHGWRALDARWQLFPTAISATGLLHRTDTRIDAILWGCFAALLCARYAQVRVPRWAAWVVLAALLGVIVVQAPALPLLLALLFPCLIVSTALNPSSALARVLELGPVRWVGRLSYSLYVWQTLFLQTGADPDPDWLARLKVWPINVCMIFLCSIATHYLLEQPAIRLGRTILRRFSPPSVEERSQKAEQVYSTKA
jgi:peptidoglycan/LPS O-acetylase OafA/YrhL